MSTNNATTLIVDFDRTVFDSDALYRDLYSLCEVRGILQDRLDHSVGLVPLDNLLFNFFLMVERNLAVEALQSL